ncbi:uncharacterized protein [Miscanthus floridulus]|uniref:uncharacterized protein n=1 Tax=Miscanthus floridulus TaxID=154761 RepID=UPI003458BA90
MAALSRFISRLDEKGLPFFELLKASERFSWSEEVDTAFEQLKLFLTKPSIMTVPRPDKTLVIYSTATSRVVSTANIVEREEVGHAYKVQRLVYFISEVLNEPKTRYPQVQKLLYVILITSSKLRHYFEYYKIIVVTEFSLGDILRNKEANGRVIKWAIELGTYSIEFKSRPTIKSQALADFVTEWTEIQELITATCLEHWVMYFDGALNINGAGAVPSPAANWREQFIKYLTSAEVAADKTETEHLISRSKHFMLVDDNLMRKRAKEGIL